MKAINEIRDIKIMLSRALSTIAVTEEVGSGLYNHIDSEIDVMNDILTGIIEKLEEVDSDNIDMKNEHEYQNRDYCRSVI